MLSDSLMQILIKNNCKSSEFPDVKKTVQLPVMIELRERPDLDYLTAQISTGTKELDDLVKDVSKRATTPPVKKSSGGSASSWPLFAQPQEPRLVDAPYRYEGVRLFWDPAGSEKGGGEYGRPWIRMQLTVSNARH